MSSNSDHTVVDHAEGCHAGQSLEDKAHGEILPDHEEGRTSFIVGVLLS